MKHKKNDDTDYYISSKIAKTRFQFNTILQSLDNGNTTPAITICQIEELKYPLLNLLRYKIPSQLRAEIVSLISKMNDSIMEIETKSTINHNDNLDKDNEPNL